MDPETTNDQAKPDELTSEEEDILFGGGPDDRQPPFPIRHRRKDRNGNILEDKSAAATMIMGTSTADTNNKSSNINRNVQQQQLLDHSTTNPMINKLHTLRESKLENCPQLWTEMAQINPTQIALIDDHLCDSVKIQVTFAQMEELVRTSAAIFQQWGVGRGSNVALFAENSARWLMADHGIQRAGGASAVRGADAPLDELRYIYDHSDSAGVVVLQGPKLLKRFIKDTEEQHQRGAITTTMNKHLGLSNEKHGPVKHILLLNQEKTSLEEIQEMRDHLGIDIQLFAELLNKTGLISDSQLPVLKKDDLSTIVYTSGTTGQPKGVMLTHGNLLHQISHRLSTTQPYEDTEPLPGETMVSLLPVSTIFVLLGILCRLFFVGGF
jgi:long-chain acyl-CoA synthetase